MLYIVLGLVLAALGLLIAALSTATTLWAWLSIVISLVGAAILFYDWMANRRRSATADPATGSESEQDSPDLDSPDPDSPDASDSPPDAPSGAAPDDEPGEEPTDAADLLVIAGLSDAVRVVDERPRYHLSRCTWIVGRPTLPLPVSEARQLGFTPCAVCSPDSVLADRYRDKKRQTT